MAISKDELRRQIQLAEELAAVPSRPFSVIAEKAFIPSNANKTSLQESMVAPVVSVRPMAAVGMFHQWASRPAGVKLDTSVSDMDSYHAMTALMSPMKAAEIQARSAADNVESELNMLRAKDAAMAQAKLATGSDANVVPMMQWKTAKLMPKMKAAAKGKGKLKRKGKK